MTGAYVDLSQAAWRKSSYSGSNGGQCVEAATMWRKSSYSGSNGGDCVEAASDPSQLIAIRDSKDPSGPKLLLTPTEWGTFTASIKALR
jgi:Domain of unknown function (DUF397)